MVLTAGFPTPQAMRVRGQHETQLWAAAAGTPKPYQILSCTLGLGEASIISNPRNIGAAGPRLLGSEVAKPHDALARFLSSACGSRDKLAMDESSHEPLALYGLASM